MTYYGHTVRTLTKRKYLHLYQAKHSGGCVSKQIINAGDWEMVWLEDYPCASLKEAMARGGGGGLKTMNISISLTEYKNTNTF